MRVVVVGGTARVGTCLVPRSISAQITAIEQGASSYLP